jgi:hypothetical protein
MATVNYTNQAPYQETIFGGLVSFRQPIGSTRLVAISGGCFFRLGDALIPTMKIDYNTYSFTASYDITMSSLKPSLNSNGGWEFSVYLRGRYKRYMDRMDCPRFEQEMTTQFD